MPSLPSSGGVGPPSSPHRPETEAFASSPMLVTPKRPGQLPTLKELLASAKKAKPVSTKKLSILPVNILDKGKEKATVIELEISREEGTEDDRETLPPLPFPEPYIVDDPFTGLAVDFGYDAASPTKSLSSLAESDSDSDEDDLNESSMHNIDDDFDPPYASTQAQAQGQGAGSGFAGGWMGYSSQFDLNGKVDQVTKFMEKDVDYDGWLRDPTPDREIEESQ